MYWYYFNISISTFHSQLTYSIIVSYFFHFSCYHKSCFRLSSYFLWSTVYHSKFWFIYSPTSLLSHFFQCHNVSFVVYHFLGYFLHLSRLQHCAYIPRCHFDMIIPYPLLCPFPICSIYPRLVMRFLNKIAFYRMGLLAPCPTPNLEV
jgi:hypothetical protein